MQKQLLMHVHKTIHAEHYTCHYSACICKTDRHSMGSKQCILYAIWCTLLIWLQKHWSLCFLHVAKLYVYMLMITEISILVTQ